MSEQFPDRVPFIKILMIPKISAFPTRNRPTLPPQSVFLLNFKWLIIGSLEILISRRILFSNGGAPLGGGGARPPFSGGGIGIGIGIAIRTTDFVG